MQFNPAAIAPGLAQFKNYRPSQLRGDIMGGLTVAAYLVPQVMAYAGLAGLPPVVGLWASLVPLVLYAIFGTSRTLSAGPESTTALMTGTIVAPLAAGDPAMHAGMAAMLALMVGILCLFAGFIRLGFLADLLSRPVLVGYMAGLAIIMICSQLGKLTGAPVEGDGIVDQIKSLISVRDQFHTPTIIFSMAVLAVLLLFGKLIPKWPGPLFAVLLATAAVAFAHLDKQGIKTIGEVPAGLPKFGFSHLTAHAADVNNLMAAAVGIAIVSFADTVLTARSFATRDGSKIDANAELRAMGVYNIGAAVGHGFPVSSSASRTALGFMVGARSQLYSIVAMVMVIVIMLTAHNLLALFPRAALGALVVYAGMRLIEIPEFKRLYKFRRSEFLLAMLTVVAVLLLGVLYGVIAAVGLSILDLLRRVARPHDGILGFVPGLAGMHDIADYPEAHTEPGLVIYRYDAPLFFANSDDFVRRATQAVDDESTPVEWFVLNAEANVDVDLTGLDALDQLRQTLNKRGIVFGMARVKQDLRDALASAGILNSIGEDNIYMTLPTAVEAYRSR